MYLNHWPTLRNRAEMKPSDECRGIRIVRGCAGGSRGHDTGRHRNLGGLGSVFRKVVGAKMLSESQTLA